MAYNPINLGPTTTANSQAVVLPSDQVAIPVSGPLTDVQLRTTPVPVSGTFYQATQPVSGSVSVSNFPATQPVSGTFYQATQPVSIAASVAVTGPLTDTQLRASAVPIIQTSSATVGGVTPVTGSSVGGSSSIAISSSPVQVYGWYFYNPNTIAAYISFYNVSFASVGGTTPFYVLVVPPVGGANVFGIGITHGTAICIGISQGRALSTAMSTAVDYNIFYK